MVARSHPIPGSVFQECMSSLEVTWKYSDYHHNKFEALYPGKWSMIDTSMAVMRMATIESFKGRACLLHSSEQLCEAAKQVKPRGAATSGEVNPASMGPTPPRGPPPGWPGSPLAAAFLVQLCRRHRHPDGKGRRNHRHPRQPPVEGECLNPVLLPH